MEITIKYLREKFDEFNTLYFGGNLPKCLIKINNTRRRFGTFTYNKLIGTYHISISRYDGLRKEIAIQTTLIHEMIHLWQYLNYGKSDHRVTFKTMSRKIYNLSNGKFDIHRLSNANLEDNISTEVKSIKPFKVFMVYQKQRGQYWLLSSSNTNEIAMHNYFYHRPDQWTIIKEWYSTDSKLNTLVKNRKTTRIKGRIITQNEVMAYAS
jgi:hypothetical protein